MKMRAEGSMADVSARPFLAELDGWDRFEEDVFAPVIDDSCRRSIARRVLEWGAVLIAFMVITLGLKTFAIDTFRVPSGSMAPTVDVGDRFVVNRLAYRFEHPKVGDVLVFDKPEGAPVGDARLVKRVVAVGGQVIEGRGGVLWLDGVPQPEPYLAPGVRTLDFGPVEVPLHTVFVLGDNREHSIDSRAFGAVPESLVVGRAFLRVWPLDRIGRLSAASAVGTLGPTSDG